VANNSLRRLAHETGVGAVGGDRFAGDVRVGKARREHLDLGLELLQTAQDVIEGAVLLHHDDDVFDRDAGPLGRRQASMTSTASLS